MEGSSKTPSRPTPPRPVPPTPRSSANQPPRPPVPPVPPRPPVRPKPTPPPARPPVQPIKVPVETKATEPLASSSPQQEVNSLLKSEKLSIRTMQDDLAAARAKPAAVAPAPTSGVARPSIQGITAKPLNETPTVPTADDAPEPLPPSKLQQPGKVVMAPPKKPHQKRSVVRVLAMLLGIVILGSGATIGWLVWEGSILLPSWLSFSAGPDAEMTEVAAAGQVIPAQTAVVAQYRLATAADRSSVLSAWNRNSAEPSMATLLSGDPRLLINEPTVETIYYVVLEGDTRPYFVAVKTPPLASLFSTLPQTQVAEKDGWYIVHSVDTAPYLALLEQSTLEDVGGNTTLDSTAADVPFRYVLGPSALIRLREHSAGATLANGLLQEVSLAGRTIAQDSALDVAGVGHLLAAPEVPADQLQSSQADQQLYSFIPETATAMVVGASFAADLTTTTGHTAIVDQSALDQAGVRTFVDSLTTPYAFYVETTPGGRHDFGLIISLPLDIQGTLQVPDTTTEAGLSALLPLITGRKGIAPIAFNNHIYNDIPLRYANFSEPSQALDYAFTAQHLLITTSRESMFNLLDTYTGVTPSVANSVSWANLLATWGAIPPSPTFILSKTTDAVLTSLLPGGGTDPFAFGLSLTPQDDAATEQAVQGVVVFPVEEPVSQMPQQ